MYLKNVLKRKVGVVILGISFSLTILSCSDDDANSQDNQGPQMMIDPEVIEGENAKVIWNYTDLGPDVWATLSTDFEDCGKGTSQSPINLNKGDIIKRGQGTGLTFDYKEESVLVALNNTHTNEFKVEKGSFVTFNGKMFELAQFHGHAKSEHEIEGIQSPLELHFVHVAEDGELLVVGVLIDEGEENENYSSFWIEENFLKTQKESVEREIEGKHDLSVLLPTDSNLYQYNGSLTTPPCSEGVNWNVFTEKITMSTAQLSLFTDIFDNNYRPVQNINQREVISTEEKDVL